MPHSLDADDTIQQLQNERCCGVEFGVATTDFQRDQRFRHANNLNKATYYGE